MDNLFNNLLSYVSSDITFSSAIITMVVALILGGVIAFTYFKTQDDRVYQRSLAIKMCIRDRVFIRPRNKILDL